MVQAALSFARESAVTGNEVVVTGWAPGPPTTVRTPEGVKVRNHPGFRHGRIGPYDLRWLGPMALRSAFSRRPSILHIHSDPNLLRLRGIAKVFHLHMPVPDTLPSAYARLIQRADIVVCCSQFVQRQFLHASGWNHDRVRVVPNGTDRERFHPATPTERHESRCQLGLSDDDFVVLYAGAIVPEKGIIHLIRSFQVAASQNSSAVLVVAGGSLWSGLGSGGEAASSYERLVAAEAGPRVRMIGMQAYSDMPAIYMAADAFVIASIWDEPFPLAVLDALAVGLPIVATQTGGLPEIVLHDRTGLPRARERGRRHDPGLNTTRQRSCAASEVGFGRSRAVEVF